MRLSLDLGLGSLATMGGGGYVFTNAEAAALVARFTTPPTDARKALIDNLVGSLKTGGVWAKSDAFYVLAAADSQASRQNWVQDAYNLTAINSPAFVADHGTTGNGTTSYLETSFNPTTAPTPKFTQDSAALSLWSRTNLANGAGVSADFGAVNSNIMRNQSVSGQSSGRPNYTPTITIADGAYPGHVAWSRTAAGVWESYVAGVDAGGGTQASAAPTNAGLRIHSQGSAFGVNQIAAAHIGSGLSAAEAAALYAALNTYMQAVGAA